MWWEYIIIAALLVLGVYCFKVLTGFETRLLTRKSSRSAESIYRNYAGQPGQPHHARRNVGPPHDGG